MGVHNLNKILTRHSPNAFFTIPITMLKGKRIAVDAGCWQYSSMAIARKRVINTINIITQELNIHEVRREWIILGIDFIVTWLSYGVTPVVVFDGKSLPEKCDTKEKRNAARIEAKKKIDLLYEQIHSPTTLCNGPLVEELKKKLSNWNFIADEEFELFKMIMENIGVPCLQAVADAEHLCSSLCIEGKVAGVYSLDTDNLVYGCPLLITGFSKSYCYVGNTRVKQLDCVRLDKALEGLRLNHNVFVDMCIMFGCDFNTSMPNVATKSYDVILRYGSIDNLPPDKYNTACLKHIRCREIFSFVSSNELIVGNIPLLLDINKDALKTARDYLSSVGAGSQMHKLINVYSNITLSQDGYIDELGLTMVPKYFVRPSSQVILNILPSDKVFNIVK